MAAVTIDQPERMNLLGLMLADIVGRNIDSADGTRALARLARPRATVTVASGPMVVTLQFGSEGLLIRRGRNGKPSAELHAELDTLMSVALGGELAMLLPVLLGKLRVRGNPLLLLQMRPLLKV